MFYNFVISTICIVNDEKSYVLRKGWLYLTRKTIMYQCEICKSNYITETEAASCETIGTEIPLAKVGDLVDVEREVGGGFDNIFFEFRIREISSYDGHFLTYNFDEYSEYNEEWVEASFSAYSNSNFLERVKLRE